MNFVELLSPAGNFESLKLAIENGCNAVYFAGKRFGARAFSNNFTEDELIDAINYCHLYGVKAYITINTLIFENEVPYFLDYVEFLYKNGCDAVIIQDYGMADLLHKTFPKFELHASTQMNIHTVDELKKAKEFGFKRVVLARECSIDIIKQMKKEVDIELEVFVHGALCVSYSGQCLMSFMIGKRSGNRGECAGCCRQKYKLYENDKQIKTEDEYLLSTKDLCLIDNLKELIKIGVDSFKIEGRMKSKEYIAAVTKAYRNALDNKLKEEDKLNMLKMFNREYTLGNIFNKKGKEFINGYRPNHKGYLIGRVINQKNNKVYIKLIDDIKQGDGIRIATKDEMGFILNKIYKNNLLVNSANTNDIISIDLKNKVKIGTNVYKTLDIKLINEINNDINNRKIKIFGSFIVENNNIIFKITDGTNEIIKTLDNVVSEAKNKPITSLDIKEKLNKLGNTPFIFKTLEVNIPNNIFIPITIINNLKREVIDELISKRIKINKIIKNKYIFKTKEYNDSFNYIFDVQSEEQLKYILEKTNYLIYVSDYKIYKKYELNERIFFKKSRINPLPIKINKEYISGEISNIKENTVADVYLNVTNSYTVSFLHNLGAKRVTLSYELDYEKIKELIENYKNNYKLNPNLELIVYGKPEVMVSKYCIQNTYIGNGEKTNCNLCKKNRYFLEDKFKNKYEIIKNSDCNMRIIDYKNINLINEIINYKKIGIKLFRFILNDEDENKINEIIKLLK